MLLLATMAALTGMDESENNRVRRSTLGLSGGRNPESGEYIYCYITAELLDSEGKELR